MKHLLIPAILLASLAGCVGPGGDPPVRTAAQETRRISAGLPPCPSLAPIEPNDPRLPSLNLECLGGQHRLNLAHLRGEPTLLVAFAQWCGPCRQELPVLSRGLAGQRVRVILVNTQESSYDDAIELLERTHVAFPVVIDEDGQLRRSVKAAGLPFTVLVDREGKIAKVHVGGWRSVEQLADELRDSLGVR